MNDFTPSAYTRIGKQFVLIVAGMIVLALLSNAFFQYHKEKNRALHNIVEKANSLGDLLSSISVEPLLIYDNASINDLVKHTAKQSDVIYTVFVDRKGQVITRHLNTELEIVNRAIKQTNTNDLTDIFVTLQSDSSILHFSYPVNFDGINLATLHIGLNAQSLTMAPLQNLYIQLSSSLFFGLMIGIGIYIGFLKKISGPIEKLSHSAKNIARLNFDETIEVRGNNEITELARSFDSMRLALKNAEIERLNNQNLMEQLNSSLEDRVKERTIKLEKLNSQISYQALHDPLTGLANRTLVIERLNQAIEYAARNNKRLAVFILDLNNFKDINDTLGHPEGDIILKQVASRIPDALRSSDTIGRLGGDEFAVVLPDIDQSHAIEVAKKIIHILKPGFELRSHIIDINASIGIAIYPEHGDDQTALIRHADVAMYESKRRGHGFSIYNAEFDIHTPWRLALMADLRQAIEEDRLELYYQPQLDLHNNRIYGVEALLRWDHEIQGQIPPDQFIYIAENSELIQPLTRWVLKQSMMQWRIWKDQGVDIHLSINISARNLNDSKLARKLDELIKLYQVTKENIKLEFTESALMANPDAVLDLMQDENLNGISYSIDDFGTGYSSLSYLKNLPVNEVKIDKSFVRLMDSNDDDESIVNSVIDLAHNLGHKVVAEGVETDSVMCMLKKRGCDSVQGYLLSHPVSAKEIPELFNEYNQANDNRNIANTVNS